MALEGLFRIKKLYKEDRSIATVKLSRERGQAREVKGCIGSPTSNESGHPTQLTGEGKLIIEVDADTVVHVEPVL